MQEFLFETRRPLVNGSRVRQAREMRGYTQANVAAAIYVDQTMIAHIEGGSKQPTSDLLEALTGFLDLPTSFFLQGDCLEMPKGSLLFRSKAVVGKRAISQAHEHSRLSLEMALRLSTYANLIPVRVPALQDPLEAAQSIRKLLLMDSGPILNLIRHIEKLGIVVIPLPEARDFDAFATWAGPGSGLPVIGLATDRPTDRTRMSAAHELGHLVLHRSRNVASKENEEEAYIFAAELLMPSSDIHPDLAEQKLTLFRLAELKKKWQTSMQALARRARELQIINDRQYRYLMMQLSQRGWRLAEPTFSEMVERPRALRKLAEVAYGEEDTWPQLATDFNLSLGFVHSVLSSCDPASATTSLNTNKPSVRRGGGPILLVSRTN